MSTGSQTEVTPAAQEARTVTGKPELLAPAGSLEVLRAALEAGADAVYLGLNTLNARRGAQNFLPDELAQAVDLAKAHGARVFLTLNIMLTPREVGAAARALELARQCGVAAVLFADPAFLLLKEHYPQIEFHLSTQAAITNSAGVLAAADLGITRAVLAREMSLAEIEAATGIAPVQTEVFVQGALCLCISGRCLFSSWGGGRSGNRGACTSPCRVRWRKNGQDLGTPLSMHDLTTLDHLNRLRGCGVSCFKIEGRLKNAQWVARAVRLYRAVLDEGIADTAAAQELGYYSGRQLSSGYLTGELEELTGLGARPALEQNPSEAEHAPARSAPDAADSESGADSGAATTFSLEIDSSGSRLQCTLQIGGERAQWDLPKTLVRHADRAMSLTQTGDWLASGEIQGCTLAEFVCDQPTLLVPRKTANLLSDRISSTLHTLRNAPARRKRRPEAELPAPVRELTVPPPVCAQNERYLGQKLNMVRLKFAAAADFLAEFSPEVVVVEDAPAQSLAALRETARGSRLLVALPLVNFENELPQLRELCAECVRLGLGVEVNGWDGWRLAREAGAEIFGGHGLAILNPLAGRALAGQGFRAATYSIEAGAEQLRDLAAHCPLPSVLCVYARPVLVHTRAILDRSIHDGDILEDARKIRVRVERTRSLTLLRTAEPFSIAHLRDERIIARWLCADLCGETDPITAWQTLRRPQKSAEVFNFERGLY